MIPDGPGPSSDEPRETASVVLGQLTAEALREARERAADVNEVLSGYRSGSEDLAGPGEPRREYAHGVPLMQRYAAKAAERRVSVRTVKRWIAAAREGREAALAGETSAQTEQRTENLDGLKGHIAGPFGAPLLTGPCGDTRNGNLHTCSRGPTSDRGLLTERSASTMMT